jgi:type I restriction enzyme S subunit
MIGSLKPYPEYKESGLPWLGHVPRHWDLRPAFGAYVPIHEKNRGMKEKTVLSLSYGRIVIKPAEKLHGLVPESFETYQIVNPGDIVLRTTDLQNDHTSLRVGMVRNRGIITSAYLALKVNTGVNPDFGHQFLNVWDTSKAIYGYGSGLRQNLDFTHFKRMPVALPPPDEQAAIVRFLDYANGRLERTIRAKTKVIALLNEQKQAIIHRAVTRGLDSNVPLKPSGIPWLGDIPQHWEVSRVKNEFRCLNTRRVPLNSVQRGRMTLRAYDYYGASGVIDKVDDYLFDGELLLIAEDGANLVLRNLPLAIIAKGKFWVNNHAHILKPKRGNIVYLANILETLNYTPWISGAAQPKLTKDRLLSISIAVAPTGEQDAIVRHTSEQTRPLVVAISRLEREIEFMREYRSRLVADVVTGKLDVRKAASKLPDEAVSTEPMSDVEEVAEEAEELNV